MHYNMYDHIDRPLQWHGKMKTFLVWQLCRVTVGRADDHPHSWPYDPSESERYDQEWVTKLLYLLPAGCQLMHTIVLFLFSPYIDTLHTPYLSTMFICSLLTHHRSFPRPTLQMAHKRDTIIIKWKVGQCWWVLHLMSFLLWCKLITCWYCWYSNFIAMGWVDQFPNTTNLLEAS